MASRDFDETVTKVADRIGQGRVLLSERVRSGKRRSISVGPYHTATATKRQYGMIVLPALPGESDLYVYPMANRAAREFVRFVGVGEAKNALSVTPRDASVTQIFGTSVPSWPTRSAASLHWTSYLPSVKLSKRGVLDGRGNIRLPPAARRAELSLEA